MTQTIYVEFVQIIHCWYDRCIFWPIINLLFGFYWGFYWDLNESGLVRQGFDRMFGLGLGLGAGFKCVDCFRCWGWTILEFLVVFVSNPMICILCLAKDMRFHQFHNQILFVMQSNILILNPGIWRFEWHFLWISKRLFIYFKTFLSRLNLLCP